MPRSVDELCPPFFVVEMPISIDGHGPEMHRHLIAYTTWEIWDQLNLSVCTVGDKDVAKLIAQRLNM